MQREAHVAAEEEVLAQFNTSDLLRVVSGIQPAYRQVILLHYFEDLSITEIAEILSISAQLVRTRLHRARKLLRQVMEQEGVAK